MFHEENKIFHNSDQAQVFITFFEKVVTKALIGNKWKNGKDSKNYTDRLVKEQDIFVIIYSVFG